MMLLISSPGKLSFEILQIFYFYLKEKNYGFFSVLPQFSDAYRFCSDFLYQAIDVCKTLKNKKTP